MVHFVGAGPGDPELITVRGARLLERADVVIYAGSLVNPELLRMTRADCRIWNSAYMTLEQVTEVIRQADLRGEDVVRLHTGDPSLYGAVREQMDALDRLDISYDNVPGVSSFSAAAASLGAEFTLPGVSQSLIITRAAGKTPVPSRESLSLLAAHGASMALFLSAGILEQVQEDLLKGGLHESTPAAIVYKASWPEERQIRCTVGTLAKAGQENGISRTALILVGDFLEAGVGSEVQSGEVTDFEAGRNLQENSCADREEIRYERSRLYDPEFSTGFRKGRDAE